ncbi:hypothetical protein M0813_20466 [Anaeramoeba flamelloides]|uniref:Uncharacterized protein n=1 Tax=Anaeramoeba flamelloides TaxID=1746091 RepID=A0ABQ8YL16_9EUKA|nr:hypothetical protein M0813_20466 [Anaeramoeba flamelloides]
MIVPWFIKDRKQMRYILLLRIAFFLFTVISIFATIGGNWEEGKWLVYLTNWTWTLQCVFQFLISYHTYKFITKWPKSYSTNSDFLWVTETTKSLKLLWIFWEHVFCLTFLVFLFYWAILYSPKSKPGYSTVVAHGINCVFTMIEIMFNRTTFPLAHFPFMFVFALIYLFVTIIYYFAAGKDTIYSVINVSKALGWLVFFLTIVFVFVLFIAGKALSHLRDRIWKNNSVKKLEDNEDIDAENELVSLGDSYTVSDNDMKHNSSNNDEKESSEKNPESNNDSSKSLESAELD